MKKNNKKTIAELKKICNPIYKQAFIEAEKSYNEILRKAGLKIMKIADKNGYVINECGNPDAKKYAVDDFVILKNNSFEYPFDSLYAWNIESENYFVSEEGGINGKNRSRL